MHIKVIKIEKGLDGGIGFDVTSPF